MIRITHVIDGLSVGGAEVMLANLLRRLDPAAIRSEVISLTDIGPVGRTIEGLGIPVRALGLRPTPAGALGGARLPLWVRRSRPDIVQTWLYQADLLGGLSARVASRRAPVIWGVHRSDLDPTWTKPRLARVARLCALASRRVPTRIVCCSEDAARRHIALGYASDLMAIIPNGFDISAYAPDEQARASVRAELGVAPDVLLVGMVARFDPQKDHANVLRAAIELARTHPDAHVVLCGAGVDRTNADFTRLVDELPGPERLHLLGLRRDIPRIDAALDVAVLSSRGGEAFPLAIGEAMASGVPCVVTDVGDAASLVGDTGTVVTSRDHVALADAIRALLDLAPEERRALGRAARARVEQHFELDQAVDRYRALYDEVLGT
jgi:glycosyltransferase involved in cell wall biosynthesis